jgi:ribosomal protein L11 methyltransferase
VIRLAVRVRREHAELVLAQLLELAPAGVEEAAAGDHVEYAVYGAPGELPSLPDLKAAAGAALVEISTTEVADDWPERWRCFHRPVLIAAPQRHQEQHQLPGLYVRPPWELPLTAPKQAVEDVVIDPGQAFGTGAHASTRLCLTLLLSLAAREGAGAALLDVGTGSGVLAIAAARLGFAPVLGVDHDPVSVRAARENAAANGVQVSVRQHDLRSAPLPLPEPRADQQSTVVVANLLWPLLSALADALPAAPAHLLASGLLADQVSPLVQRFGERFGARERERRERGEWAAVWLSVATRGR